MFRNKRRRRVMVVVVVMMMMMMIWILDEVKNFRAQAPPNDWTKST